MYRKTTSDILEAGSLLASTNVVQKNHTDDVSDMLNAPGLFCYRIEAVPNGNGDSSDKAASNWVCLTEEPLVWIPTAFSPNGDDLNDWFPWPAGDAQVGFLGAPQGGNSNFELNVYSRWAKRYSPAHPSTRLGTDASTGNSCRRGSTRSTSAIWTAQEAGTGNVWRSRCSLESDLHKPPFNLSMQTARFSGISALNLRESPTETRSLGTTSTFT